MRIISDFRDYYDRHHPGDPGAVYVRKTLTIDDGGVVGVVRKLVEGLRSHTQWSGGRKREPERVFEPVVVSFCGRPVVRYREPVRSTEPFWDAPAGEWSSREVLTHRWYDSFEAADAAAEFTRGWGTRAEIASAWARLLAADTTDLHHALQTPLVAVYFEPSGWSSKMSVQRDPLLKGLDFGRMVPADQCFQAIEQFVEGVLATRESYPTPSDSVLLESKGFDPKWSFRNPDPPRRKRKKR